MGAGPSVNLIQAGFGNPSITDASNGAAAALKLLQGVAPVKAAGAAIAGAVGQTLKSAGDSPISLSSAPVAPVEATSAGSAMAAAVATPTPAPLEFKGFETKKAPLCSVPKNLTYCTGVTYAVPYQGWSEWEVYVEQTLKYYMDHLYTDNSESESDEITASPAPMMPTKIKMNTAPECVEAMKAVGCAYYFPKCSEKEEPLPPCKSLCKRWKKDLKCPGSMAYGCEGDNGGSFAFAAKDSTTCTNYV